MEYVLADAAVGWLLIAVPVVALIMFFLVAAGEALVMNVMDWGTFKRCLIDSLLINLVSTIPGIVMGQYFDTMEFLGLIAAFAVTLVIEGVILSLLKRHPVSRSLLVALAANLASYLLIAFFYLAD